MNHETIKQVAVAARDFFRNRINEENYADGDFDSGDFYINIGNDTFRADRLAQVAISSYHQTPEYLAREQAVAELVRAANDVCKYGDRAWSCNKELAKTLNPFTNEGEG